MKRQILCMLMIAATAAFAEERAEVQTSREAPLDKTGRITLSWEEFQKMWEELHDLKGVKHEKPEPPPVDFVLSKARYSGKVQNGVLEISAIMDLNVLKEKTWVQVPFLPSGVALKDALLDGQPAAVESLNGYHTIVTHLPGKHTLQVRFSQPYPKRQELPAIDMALPMTSMTLLELELPQAGLDVQVSPSQGIRLETVGGKTRLVAALPPTASVHVQWQKALPPEQHQPSKLYVETQEVVHVSENALGLDGHFQYSILHSPVSSVRMSVPENVNVLAVRADSLREWKVSGEKGKKMLTVYFSYPKSQAVEVDVQAELPIKDSAVADLPRIVALDVEREQGFIGVEANGVIELKTESAKGLRPIDVKELPGPIWRTAKNPLLLGFRYLQQPYALALNIQRHQEVAVLTTAVDSANAVTLFIKEGLTVTHASYQVRNHLKQFMAFELPDGSEIWSAFVNGQPVKPAKDKQGKILIPLAKSAELDGNNSFPLEITYYTKMPKFHLAGYKASFLPAPDVPVSQMLWSVYMPPQFRFLKFWGDMEKEDLRSGIILAASSPVPLRDFDQLNAYEKDDLKVGAKKAWRRVLSVSGMAGGMNAPVSASVMDKEEQVVEKQANMETEFARNLEANQTGVLPVAFAIPARGELYRFGKLLVVGENPEIQMVYVHFRVLELLAACLALLLGRSLYRKRRQILEAMALVEAKAISGYRRMAQAVQARSKPIVP